MNGMVDITQKEYSLRTAVAEGRILLKEETIDLIKSKKVEKGDVFEIARVAAILAVKKTPELIPHCHPIPITSVDVDFSLDANHLDVRVTVKALYKTGVEMEALTATTVALLTIWDLVKKYEKNEEGQYPYTRIEYVRVVKKEKENLAEKGI